LRASRSSNGSPTPRKHSFRLRADDGSNHDRHGQIYLYQIVGNGQSNQELRTIQDWIVKLKLRTVPGVADVLSFGGDVKQYQVIVDQQALVNYNITLKVLFEAIQANNQNTGREFHRAWRRAIRRARPRSGQRH
jgi:Cu/Ag efflux pump CusA